jgi:cysteine synthase A
MTYAAEPLGLRSSDRHDPGDRAWVDEAVRKVEADANRAADTHLVAFPLPADWGIDLYLKDESTHPSGSLKHRLARSLFRYALCHGWIHQGTTVVEASSGSTAVSEAYFARMIGLPFVAVLPAGTSRETIELVEFHGGKCHLVNDPATVREEARRLADGCGGHYMDQFGHAERASDWRGNNTLAESIYRQMSLERYPVPRWIVVGAGTGATSATIGRFIRQQRLTTRLCVVDPEYSAYFDAWTNDDPGRTAGRGSRIEGIGRQRVEPSFVPSVIDRMVRVPDAASIAAMRYLHAVTGLRAGGSTGSNLWAALQLVTDMRAAGQRGSVVTLLCDGGERYRATYYDDFWLAARGIDLTRYAATLDRFQATGEWPDH